MFGRYTVDDSNQPTVGAFAQSETILSSRDQFATLENHIGDLDTHVGNLDARVSGVENGLKGLRV